MILFYKNTSDLTTVEEHLLKLIAPKPTNAHMNVTVNYYETVGSDAGIYETLYFLPSPKDLIEDEPIGHWVAGVINGTLTKKYFPEIEKIIMSGLLDTEEEEQ